MSASEKPFSSKFVTTSSTHGPTVPGGALGFTPQTRVQKIKRCLIGNLTPWWLLSSILTIYFLISLGVPHIGNDSPVMDTHIPFAFLFTVCCISNLYHTPSHGPVYATIHRYAGWTAMIVGFFSVLTGYVYILDGSSHADLGTKVLMMAIGAMQVVLQILGVWYVRGLRWIEQHMAMMTYMFYMSAVLISINWLPKMITGEPMRGSAGTNWMFVSMLAGAYGASISVRYNIKQMDLSSM
mmetsp:Transcript_20207/g.59604  ORF Transcript_20207/g.59604 Transcript_20207/m.59604 type:complete len:239 (+) Transcript_20207:72-788(+)|eukprot:CAMPEP_0206036378 /NCGR_PEP_ID=MMETSP1466-20131121/2721_1 /ASSEMBLY_ACC=CAM_ASM_001126 /TAXON_ID=44452 /ORGANISM="Pavlova gyrans, Strain CCMP608" /LENGTH=238 /DNA_ID=CAMNT_0053410839 /DNA_START=42 /DNA_END=758 /DNA_ORIENTATION=+